MALAKVYDSEDTLMVPLDLEGTEGLSEALMASAAVVEKVTPMLSEYATALRNLADSIDDARTAAGLDTHCNSHEVMESPDRAVNVPCDGSCNY